MSKNYEQRIFEEWYRLNAPSGDCESVHRQWLESSEYKDFCLKLCPSCCEGTIKEMSIYDDMDGMLTCDKCGVRVKV